jgi:hypothetical protein
MAKPVKMVSIEKLKNIVHGPNLVELKPWKSRHDTITAPMISAMGQKDVPGNQLSIGFAHIDKPDTIIDTSHKHPHDQWIMLVGSSDNFVDFDADIEFGLDNKIYKINYPFYAFIPAGTYHCPLIVKRVGKPIIFIDARVSEEASGKSRKPATKKAPVKATAAKKPAAKKPLKKA